MNKLLTIICLAVALAICFVVAVLPGCKTQKNLDSQIHQKDSTHRDMSINRQGTAMDSTATIIHLDTSKIQTLWNYEKQTRIQKSWDTIKLDSGKVILKPKTDTWITEWGNIQSSEDKATSDKQATDLHKIDTSTHRQAETTQVKTNDQHTILQKKVNTKTGQIVFWLVIAGVIVFMWLDWPMVLKWLALLRRKPTDK